MPTVASLQVDMILEYTRIYSNREEVIMSYVRACRHQGSIVTDSSNTPFISIWHRTGYLQEPLQELNKQEQLLL